MDTDMEETRSPKSTTNLQHGAKKKHNVVVFPHFRDRLACDPLNFFCVYATYEYKLRDSAAEAERSIFSLVDAMVDSVRKAFDEALQHWKQMPAFLRQAHTFRAVMAIPSAPLTSTLMHLFSRKGSSVRHSLARKSAECNTSSLFGGTQTDGMASASDTVAGRNNCSTATTPRSAHRERRGEEEEEAIMKRLMQQWFPPNNYPKCRIVLDIIASRKTLGGDPPNSKPYQLGVKVFSYVKRKYPEEVITTFVGISDSSVMLVGRNILYPYRVTGGGGLKVNTTLPSPGGTRHILAGTSGLSLLSFGATDAITTSGTGGVSAMVSNLEQMLLNSIPAPRVVTAPPTNTDKVDNLRLVICFQPTDVVNDADPSCLIASVALVSSVRYLSLAELAKAFSEISDSSTAAPMEAGSSVSINGIKRQTVISSSKVDSALKTDINDLNLLDDMKGTTARVRQGNFNSGVVTFSPLYSKNIGAMSGSQLALLLERECKQQHFGHMLQCLVEVWRRLRETSLMNAALTDEEARRCRDTAGGNAEVLYLFRSDDLLEYVLRILAKVNLDDVQQSLRLTTELHSDSIGVDWVTEFGCLLIQWITARADSLTPSQSATFLHLISQQKVFHSDALLETLRDNIEVYILNHFSTTSSTPSPKRVNNEFSVSDYSLLLDAIARWQTNFLRLLGPDSAVTQSRLQLERTVTFAITSHYHPIANAPFYDIVLDGLLRGLRDGSLHLTRHGSPTSFFFLTLALAKIRWFRVDCIDVLLPQLHEALRVFPGQFLGVLLLLGRREVNICNVGTTQLLFQTLLDVMQKRGQRYNSVDERKRQGHHDSVTFEASVTTFPIIPTTTSTAVKDASSLSSLAYEEDGLLEMPVSQMDNDDDDLHLFSVPSSKSLGDKGGAILPSHDNGSGKRVNTSQSSSSSFVFSTSFLDLRSVPVFLDSLNHIYTTTLEHCIAQGKEEQQNTLNKTAGTLYETLLNDTHRGVKSLNDLQKCPGLVEKLLLSVLRTPLETNHPFLIELAYTFTRHVAVRHGASHNTTSTTEVAPRWQWRTMNLVELLVQRGVIESETYVMTDDIIQLAPRVHDAVEAEKKRLLERHHESQRQHAEGHVKRKKKVVRTSAVFARFSRVVVYMKQQI